MNAISALPDPRDLVTKSDAVNVVQAVAYDAAVSFLLGGNVGQTVRSSATRKGRPQYDSVRQAYGGWWRSYGPPVEKATKAMHDALTRASIQLGVDSARQ